MKEAELDEAAVLGLTGVVVARLGKVESLPMRETNTAFTVEPILERDRL